MGNEALERNLSLKGRATVGLITLLGTGLGFATGVDMDTDHRGAARAIGDRYERNLNLVKSRIASGDGRVVRLSSLSAAERADLGTATPETADDSVTLPSPRKLSRAIAQKDQEANDVDEVVIGETTLIFGGLAYLVGMGVAGGLTGRKPNH